MSRSINKEDRDRFEENSPNRERRGVPNNSFSELARIIDSAAARGPTMAEFVERLEQRDVAVIPSIQSSGRLNGFAFRWKGNTVKGSTLGREYTPNGLQQRKGVSYNPHRDDEALIRAAERAGLRRPDRADYEPRRERDPSAGRVSRMRDWESGLSSDQKATLAEIGKFRTVNVEDLLRHRYSGNAAQFVQDARVIKERGLAVHRTVKHARTGRTLVVMVLTRKGQKILRGRHNSGRGEEPEQRFYAGFVKPAEVPHDAGIYRMYQVEAARIEKDGGSIRRVVLDYELKKGVYSELNKERDSASEFARRKQEIATQNGLELVNGRIVFPDLRIEYETREREQERVDLELATDQYKDAEVQQKRAAGLKIYGPDSAPRSPALQDPEIVAGLISF